MDEDLVVPEKDKSLNEGAILPFKNMEDTNIYIQKAKTINIIAKIITSINNYLYIYNI